MKKTKRLRPWAKLWRYESPRFRALPARARLLAAYLLKVVDDAGRLPLGHRDPVTAVSLAIAADVADRRWLRVDVALLLEHGYLKADGDTLLVSNYPRWQELDDVIEATDAAPPSPASPPSRRETNATSTRDERDSNVSATRDERETDARIESSVRNDSMARTVLLEDREKREERREGEGGNTTTPSIPSLDEIASTFGSLRKAAGYGGFKRARSQFRDEERLRTIEQWLSTESDPRATLERAIRGFLACDRARTAEYPLAFLANDLPGHLARFEREHATSSVVAAPSDPELEQLRAQHTELVGKLDEASRRGNFEARDDLHRAIREVAQRIRDRARRSAAA